MTSLLRRFLKDQQWQDLIEYALLLAFVCLASAALFISAEGGVGGSANRDLAATIASSTKDKN